MALVVPVHSAECHAFLNSSYGSLPRQRRVARDLSVTVHPAAATIQEGRLVRVFNDRGAFQAIARISDSVRAGVAVAPLGYWRKLSPAASTVSAVNSPVFADLGNAPTFSDNLVEIATVD